MGRPARIHADSKPLEVHPLTPARLEHLGRLFASGDPRWCWCTFYRRDGRYWGNSTAAKNRAELAAETRRLHRTDRRAPGLIAYVDGEPAGWVSVGPREDYERVERSKVLAPVDDRPVWSIVCFVVGRRFRRRGIGHALLDAAVEYAREHGATLLEAYPVDTSGERFSSSSVYTGTLSMFERAGFEVVARRQANRISPVRPIVRRRIRRRRPKVQL